MKKRDYPIWYFCGSHRFKAMDDIRAWVYVFNTPISEQTEWFK